MSRRAAIRRGSSVLLAALITWAPALPMRAQSSAEGRENDHSRSAETCAFPLCSADVAKEAEADRQTTCAEEEIDDNSVPSVVFRESLRPGVATCFADVDCPFSMLNDEGAGRVSSLGFERRPNALSVTSSRRFPWWGILFIAGSAAGVVGASVMVSRE